VTTSSSRRLWLWGPVALYMAAIFTVSAMPEPPAPPGVDDKTLHVLAYAGLGVATLRATSGGTLAGVGAATALTAWAIATVYAVSDEFHQGFVPGRTRDGLDLAADAIGAAGGIGVAWLSGILLRSRRVRGAPPGCP
jgi:VanZ family protein